ncbi:hypothetical protein [Rhizobium sp. AG855]|nr:hypothetical protein [Rhizobium sp. AG855]RKE79359.1 hypothetical protein DFO46_4091 [Rhizobium sp. AG855]
MAFIPRKQTASNSGGNVLSTDTIPAIQCRFPNFWGYVAFWGSDRNWRV